MDSERDFIVTGLGVVSEQVMLIGGRKVKKFLLLLVLLTLFMAMGITVQAKSNGDNGQSEKLYDLLEGELSEYGADIEAWLSEELVKEENKERIENVIDFICEKLEAGELDTDEEISNVIQEGEEKFEVTLTEDEKEKILQVVQKIKDLGLDPEKLLNNVENLYKEVGADLVKDAEETVKKSFVESVTGFFQDMGSRVKGFFAGFFS